MRVRLRLMLRFSSELGRVWGFFGSVVAVGFSILGWRKMGSDLATMSGTRNVLSGFR